jgi:hypothetical protein
MKPHIYLAERLAAERAKRKRDLEEALFWAERCEKYSKQGFYFGLGVIVALIVGCTLAYWFRN